MTIRTIAIPLVIFPSSGTSCIVHWVTRHRGKIATILKGAMRPKSLFLGQFELFDTSELLYFTKEANTLHIARECSMLRRRVLFRSDWRAMQTASYLAFLFRRTTPAEAPQPDWFGLYEELLDLAEIYGRHPQFLLWAELRFCGGHGHVPNFGCCICCFSEKEPRFCVSRGGVVCAQCARQFNLSTLAITSDILAILRAWKEADHPASVVNTQLTERQFAALHSLISSFMSYHFPLQPDRREAVLQTNRINRKTGAE